MEFKTFVFCDLHLQPMKILANTIVTDSKTNTRWEENFYVCSEPNCHVHFNRDRGYLKIINGEPMGKANQTWCSTHNEPKAIIGIFPIGSDPQPRITKQCLHPDCAVAHSINGLIRRGDLIAGRGGRFMVLALDGQWATVEMVGDQGDGLRSVGYWDRVPIDELRPLNSNAESEK